MRSNTEPSSAFATVENVRGLVTELFESLRNRTSDGVGITRESYGETESAALDIIEEKARALSLETARDAGANLVISLIGSEPDLPFIACGSHLDSVPQGGNFDGAAGVVAGIAVLAQFAAEKFRPRRTIKLYGLRGEESARFGKAYVGSLALVGGLAPEDLVATERSGRTLADCMRSVGVDVARVKRREPLLDLSRIAAWIELHIEQGPVLAARRLPIGIVTGIRGNVRHRLVECIGQPGHSGAVPRWLRQDAVFGLAELLTRLDRHWQTMIDQGQDLVVTAGVVGTDPAEHAITRIPGRAHFSFEVRSQSKESLETYYEFFLSQCETVCKERGIEFKLDRRLESAPASMDRSWIDRLRDAASALGIPCEEMPSGAGHDAAVFANAGVPSAMIFVRNENGSHNPSETMDIDDFLAGVAIVNRTFREAAR